PHRAGRRPPAPTERGRERRALGHDPADPVVARRLRGGRRPAPPGPVGQPRPARPRAPVVPDGGGPPVTDAPWLGDACSLVDAFRAGERTPVEELDTTLA